MQSLRLFIEDSLELNLFFLRIMKEHALFLMLGFTPQNKDMAQTAQGFREKLDALFGKTIMAAKGRISNEIMSSGELFTPFTQASEEKTQAYTGVPINSELTLKEYDIAGSAAPSAEAKASVDEINREVMMLLNDLQAFQKSLLEDVLACRVFTVNYPLIIDHIIRETTHYMMMLEMLMNKETQLGPREFALEQVFWNNNLAEHAKFTDGLLDPSETVLKNKAGALAAELMHMEKQALAASTMMNRLQDVTMRSMTAAAAMRDFDMQGTKGLLSCKVRSVIVPLLADHDLREANHYIRILKETMSVMR